MKFIASKRTQRVTNFALAALLVVSTLTASLPMIFAEKANAAPSVSYVTTPLVASDWTVDRQAPSGGWTVDTSANQRVVLNVNQANSHADNFYKTEGISKNLAAGTDSIKAELYVAADWSTKPNLRVGLWGVAQGAGLPGLSYPIIEYANVDGYTGWRVWNANTSVWTEVSPATNIGGQNTVEIVSNFNTGNYDFYVNDVNVNASYSAAGYTTFKNLIFNNYNLGGSPAGNYTVIWKNIKTGSLPKVATCTATSTKLVTNPNLVDAGWDVSQTKSKGHNDLTPDGLHVYTEGATSDDKAAAYYPVNYALKDGGTPAMDFVVTDPLETAATPGLQLVVDFNNDGTPDGTLVGEAIYGNNWWLTNGSAQFVKDAAPSHGGGFGSANNGTLNAWLASFPSARVKAIGYSMGSGVYGDGTLKSLTYGCVNYEFFKDIVAPTAPSITYPNGWHQEVTNVQWTASTDQTDVTYSIYEGNHPSNVTNLIASGITGTSANYTFATGPHQIRVVATDTSGNETSSAIVGFQVIGTPKITAPFEGQALNASNGNSFTATWTGVYGVGGVKNYEVEYGIDTNNDGTIQTAELQYRTVVGDVKQRTQTFTSNFQGAMTIRVRATYNIPMGGTDKGPWSEIVNYSRDTVATAAPVVSATGVTNGYTSVSPVQINWTAPTGAVKYDYRVWTNAAGSSYNSEATAYPSNDITGNSRTGAFTEGQGTYFVQVRAIDAAGNKSDWSNTYSVVYDNVLPVIVANAPAQATVGSTVAFTGNVTDGSPITNLVVTFNGVDYELNVDDVTIAPNGDWTLANINTSALVPGNYPISATVTDKAGNKKTSNVVSLTLVAPQPVVQVLAPAGPANPGQPVGNPITPQITSPAAAVLGDTTDNDNNGSADVAGASDDKTAAAVDSEANKGTIFGLAWYWWLAILAALAAIAWFIIAAIRRRNEEEA